MQSNLAPEAVAQPGTASCTPTLQQLNAALRDARPRIGGNRGIEQLLAAYGTRHTATLTPEQRAEVFAACAARVVSSAAAQEARTLLATAAATIDAASIPAEPIRAAAVAPIAFTVFRNAEGALTKRASLDENSQLKVAAAANLVRGDHETVRVRSAHELAEIVTGAAPNEAFSWGTRTDGEESGPVATEKAIQAGDAPPGAVARSKANFSWSDGPAVMMIDIDLKDAPPDLKASLNLGAPGALERVREALVAVAPALRDVPMVVLPSTSSYLYSAETGKQLRGLTGVRAYVFADKGSNIRELGRRLHERLVVSGFGFVFTSRAGTMHLRSLIDTSVWSPERLDFPAKAICDTGIVQRREAPLVWHGESSSPITLDSIPPLTSEERVRYEQIEASLFDAAEAEAMAVREKWAEAQRAAGRCVSVTWSAAGSVEFLDGTHEIILEEGNVVSVDEILKNPARYHKQNCADPLEPDYGNDPRLARIYTLDQRSGPVIHSNAHGGINYMLRSSAAADFASAEGVSPTFRDELEEIASLIGDLDRPLASAMRTTTSGQELWVLHDRLVTAAEIPHPRRGLFDEVVLRAAKTLQSYVADVGQFARLLGAQLASDRQWTQLSDETRRVLAHAARVLLAPIDVLAGFDARTPKLVSRTAEPISYVVEPLLPDESVAALVGPPGSGKSTFATSVAAAVATPPGNDDMNQFGSCPVAHGTVLAFLSEDSRSRVAGLSKWESAYGVAPYIHLIEGTPQLSSISASLAFVQQSWALVRNPSAPPLKLIIIDLFRDSFSGDENSSKDVGAALTTARIISRMFSCTVLIVHHSALGDEKRARGSSAFSGSLDVCAATAMRDRTITLTVTKNRAGETGQTFRWHFDQDGVLREGNAPHVAPGNVNDECALTVARVVWQLADENTPISRQDLASALAEERPDLFGDTIKSGTVKSRRQRAIKAACASGWVTNRREKMIPGRVEPPNALSSTPVNVAELVR